MTEVSKFETFFELKSVVFFLNLLLSFLLISYFFCDLFRFILDSEGHTYISLSLVYP